MEFDLERGIQKQYGIEVAVKVVDGRVQALKILEQNAFEDRPVVSDR